MAIANGYVEPGVFSQFKPSTVLPVAPGGLRVAALVGAGSLTKSVSSELVVRGATPGTSDTLANTATVLASSILDANYVTYVLGVDYQLTAGAVDWSPAGAEPAAGVSYTVSYTYAKTTAEFIPKFYFNMDDVVADMGAVSTTNALSLGAEIVFQQGASVVCLSQTNPADGVTLVQLEKALDRLLVVNGINIVVPLSTDASIYAYLKTHVDTASSLVERKERTGIIGLSGTPTLSTIQGYAQGLNDKRMVLVYPPSATRFVGTNTTVSTLDGSFLAAAVAGIRTSNTYDVAEPLTRKEVTGFEVIPDTLMRSQKNLLASSGVLVIENVGGIPRVRHGLTTYPGTVDGREYSVVEIIDYVSTSTRTLLETIFIGQKILANTPAQVKSTVAATLSNLISTSIITAYDQVQAAVDSLDPTQINVSFRVSPVFPLNYILISFSLSV